MGWFIRFHLQFFSKPIIIVCVKHCEVLQKASANSKEPLKN